MAKFLYTKEKMISWGGPDVYYEAEKNYYLAAKVIKAEYDGTKATGTILHGGRPINTGFQITSSGLMESFCPCLKNRDEGKICPHVIALAIALVRKTIAMERLAEKERELQHAKRFATAQEKQLLVVRSPKGQPAELRIRLPQNWHQQFLDGEIKIECLANIPGGGSNISIAYLAERKIPVSLTKDNAYLLDTIEDICEGRITNPINLTKRDFICLIEQLSSMNRQIYLSGGNPIVIEKTKVNSKLTLDLDRETGELLMFLNTDIPNAAEGDIPDYVVFNNSGWAFLKGHLWPIAQVLPGPYHQVYHETIAIPRTETIRFLKLELENIKRMLPVDMEFPVEQIIEHPATPKMSLKVYGSQASIRMTLYANYGSKDKQQSVPAAAAANATTISIPDDNDPLTFHTRNLPYEKAAIALLKQFGISGETGSSINSIVGEHYVLNFLGTTMPSLRRKGWHVILDEKLDAFVDSQDCVVPVVNIDNSNTPGYFDVSYTFYTLPDKIVSHTDVQRAITKGEAYIKNGDKITFVDINAINTMRDVFYDCSEGAGKTPGSFRVREIYAAYLKASVEALEGSDFAHDTSPRWLKLAEATEHAREMTDIELDKPLCSTLRPYQKKGVAWLRFLEQNNMGGILADEMGLGKTLQTLSWISLERSNPENRSKPVIVVCPTSLVENWVHEAAKFVPHLKTLLISGANRASLFKKIPEANIVITSYALIRRDIEEYAQYEFAAAILDEAQNIKNRTTQNATAVKQLRANIHFVLTGTPIENSVADLWSIMDFLLPTYLGNYDTFKQNYEIPISLPPENPHAEAAKLKLRRKLHPFLLRRKKTAVAKDLPPKLEKLSWCKLSNEQQQVYDHYLAKCKSEVSSLVKEKGFERSRMEILSILLRLRQICCHLELLGDANPLPDAAEPSAKLEQFFEFFEQATSDGHRILVFSQFVKMLQLIRKELEARGIKFCYLDGSSKDRMESVMRFNFDTSIPIFLISLKAGGTGLNLTGADTVIHFDPWWNPAVEDQATDRAHRIGQKNTVYNMKLITAGTVEEKVLEMQNRKRAIIGATIESDESTMSKLTWDDIKEILEL